MMGGMKTIMKLEDLKTIDQLTDLLSGTKMVAFSVISDKDACCPRAPSRAGALTLSRQQLTRLIAQYRKTGRLQRRQRTVSGFKRKYTTKDIRLLAEMEERHDTPCGPTAKKLCERACEVFGQTEYTGAGIDLREPSVQPEKVDCLYPAQAPL